MSDYKTYTNLLESIIEKKDTELLLNFLKITKDSMLTLKNNYNNNNTPLHYLMRDQITQCSDQLKILEMFK